MKNVVIAVLLAALLAPAIVAQEDDKEERPAPASLKPVSIPQTVAENMLIHRVDPVWKHHGMEARVSGTVVLRITIGTSGHVLSSQVLSGPAILQQAAIDAVRHWEYKPYTVNGKPVEVSMKVSLVMKNY